MTETQQKMVDRSAKLRTFEANNGDQLIGALEKAEGGDLILLSSEFDDDVMITEARHGANFSEPVIIKSEDPDAPAKFGRFVAYNVKNIHIEDVVFDYEASSGESQNVSKFRFENSWGIKLKNVLFDGDVAHGSGPTDDGYPTGYGLRVNGGGDIVVEDSLFQTWHRGAVFGGAEGIRISGNEFTGMRSDGLNFSSNNNVIIEDNHIHGFHASRGSSDHRDMIQFWTNGASSPTENVIIRNNFLDAGDGDVTQSIFMRNEEVDHGRAGQEMFYRSVLIEDNVIRNGHTHGIYVGQAIGVDIRNNTVLQDDSATSSKSVFVPRITVNSASEDVSIENNIAGDITDKDNWKVDNNLIAQKWSESGPGYYGDLFVNAMLNGKASLADLQAVPESLVETMGVGAQATRFDPTPDYLMARPTFTAIDRDSFVFSGELAADADGLLGDDAVYSWDFRDGRTAQGFAVEHDFDAPGDYEVTLTVETPEGARASGVVTARVSDPVLLMIDVAGSSVGDVSSFDVPTTTKRLGIQESPEGEAFVLASSSQIGLRREQAPHLFDHDKLTVSFKINATEGRSSDGEILNITKSMRVRVDSDGDLSVFLRNDKGDKYDFRTSDADLLNGSWRDVSVVFDGEMGQMVLFVDGEALGGGEVTGRTRPLENWNIQIGATHKDSFVGLVESFEIRDAGLAEYESVTAPPSEAPAPALKPEPAPPSEAPAPVLEPEPAPDDESSASSEYFDVYLAYADTDQVVAKLDGSPEIDASEIDGRPVTIYGVPKADAPAIGSMRLEGEGFGDKIENISPYALFGDEKGDLKGGLLLEEGDHAITLTAYSRAQGGGAVLEETTLDFTVDEAAPESDSIVFASSDILDVYLAFADTDETVAVIRDGMQISLDDIEGREVTLYATAKGGAPSVGSVRLEAEGIGDHVENISPYAIFGDSRGDLNGGVVLDEGDYALTLTSYAEAQGSGSVLESVTLDFIVL